MPRLLPIAALSAPTVGAGVYLSLAITGSDRAVFLPGRTTDGHYQIELACESCHTPFRGVREEACYQCHGEELEAAEDSHPRKKFTDPRNADRVAKLDARSCMTCHLEHRPEVTEPMGVTLPADYCYHCHEGIADERPTHAGLEFNSCASAGCHNFHDNRGLYEDFLIEHGRADVHTAAATLPGRSVLVDWDAAGRRPLSSSEVPAGLATDPKLTAAWAGSAHAGAGVGCADCHKGPEPGRPAEASIETCTGCHRLEAAGFLAGRHGMRLAAGLQPMSPSEARLAMQPAAHSLTLGCGSCHDPHSVDVRRAAVDACLACHVDEHTEAYQDSPHFRLWQSELSGNGKPGSGVSCASCHLPRERRRVSGEERVVVQHNQNSNLRPNEKMIREVCMECHSLAFSIDSLADSDLVRRNFAGQPVRHVPSIDMALSRTNSPGDRRANQAKETK